MANRLQPASTNILHMQQKTIRCNNPQHPKQSHRIRIQRLTPRPPTLHRRTLPQIPRKHTKRPKLRQLHSNTRRSKRAPMVRPSPKTKRNTHHQRTPLLPMHQTHLHLRNHTPHTLHRPQLQTMEPMHRPPTRQQHQNHQHTTPHPTPPHHTPHHHSPHHPPHHHMEPKPQKPTLTQKNTKIEYTTEKGKA